MEPHHLNHISFLIIQSAIQIHRALGPGLLESIYRACMIYELRERGLKVIAEQLVPVRYGGLIFEGGYRLESHQAEGQPTLCVSVSSVSPW